MNWYRAKTILIILFLFADLFLLATIITSTHQQTTVTPEIIASTAKILKNQGITINTDLIPDKIVSVPYAEADNVISDYDEFAKLFLGDDFTKSEEFLYKSHTGTIKLDGDSFNYSRNIPYNDASITEKNAQNIASEFLESKGFNISDAEIGTEKTTDNFTIIFRNTTNSLPLFNSVVTVKISGSDVTAVSGSWFNVTGAKGQDSKLKAVTSALIDFIPSITAIPTQITELTLGYTVLDNTLYHKSAALVPVWQIKEANGNVHYPDARNPE